MMFQNTTSIPVSNRATDEKTPFLGMEKKKNPYNIFVFRIIPLHGKYSEMGS